MSAITGQGSWGWRKWFAVGATAAIGAAGLSHLLQPNQAPISVSPLVLPHPPHVNPFDLPCGAQANPCWLSRQTDLQGEADRLYGEGKVSVHPPIPKYSPMNLLRGIQWVRMHTTEKAHEAARWILNQTTHIPHAEFERALADVVDHLNPQIRSEQYALLSIGEQKSGWWVTRLAMKYLNRLPAKIFLEPKTEIKDPKLKVTYILDYCNKGEAVQSLIDSGIKTIVVFDDAVYSGTQMRETLECIHTKLLKEHTEGDFKIHVAVPFMTDHSKLWKDGKLPKQIKVSPYKKIPLALHAASKEMVEPLIRFCLLDSFPNMERLMTWFKGLTTYYFDHKIADSLSLLCSNAFLNGIMGYSYQVEPGQEYRLDKVPFIPKVTPPYKN